MPARLGLGEDRGEGRPVGIGEDLLGVLGNGCPDVVSQGAACFLVRLAPLQLSEDRGKSVVSGGLEVLSGLSGGVSLVGVVLRLVPPSGKDDRPDHGCDEGGKGAAIGAGGGVDDVAGGDPHGV
ncbi:hypothetical protein J0695_30095, partial [Streptomyces beijiangensis]|nr:hypothetical protein [Streptomyces beijiangensis]